MATTKTKTPAPAQTDQQDIAPAAALPMNLDVRINTITPGADNVRAYASVTMNGSFAVKGIKVIDGRNGLFVSMPSFKSGNGYKEHCFPVTKDFREQLHKAIFDAYGQAPTNTQDQQSGSPPTPTDLTVRINSITPNNGAVKANASVNLNGCFAIRGVKVIEGPSGLSVHMPSYKSGGEYKEHCFPVTKAFRQQVTDTVLSAYNQAVTEVQSASQSNAAEYQSQDDGEHQDSGFAQAM